MVKILSSRGKKKAKAVKLKKATKPKTYSKHVRLERCFTGIPRLDSLLSGGIPAGSVVLVSGKSGTGKTVLAMHWLFYGAHNGEPGLYLAMTEPLTKLIRNASTLNFYDRALIEKDYLVMEDLRSRKSFVKLEKRSSIGTEDLDGVIEDLTDLVVRYKARRFVLDSVTAFCRFLQDETLIRHFIFKLGKMLSYLGCTAILTSEVTDEGYSVFGVEEFISDGIFNLKRNKKGADIVRTLEIVKMRGISFNPGPHPFKITSDGIHIYDMEGLEVNEMPSTRLKSGVPGLDDMLHGGIFSHSVTLISGPSGTGKSTMALQFLLEGIKNNEKVVMFNYEEPEAQISRNVRESFSIDLPLLEKSGFFKLICRLPEELSLVDHLDEIRQVVDKLKPTRVVIDSLSALEKVVGHDELLDFTKQLILFLKNKGATSIFLATAPDVTHNSTAPDTRFSTLPDNNILLRYVEIDATMHNFIAVLKERGSDHDKHLRQYVITSSGVKIRKPLKGVQGILSGNIKHTVDNEALLKAFSDLSKKN